jgi:hypothetical protein
LGEAIFQASFFLSDVLAIFSMGQFYNPTEATSIGPAGQFSLAHLTDSPLPLSGCWDEMETWMSGADDFNQAAFLLLD